MFELLWIPLMAGLNRLRGSEIKFPVRKVYVIALALFVAVWWFAGLMAGFVTGLSFALWGSLGWGSYMDMGTQDTRQAQPEKEDPLVDILISPMKPGKWRDFAGMGLVSWRWVPFTVFFYGWGGLIVAPLLGASIATAYWAAIKFKWGLWVAEYLAGAAIGILFMGAF